MTIEQIQYNKRNFEKLLYDLILEFEKENKVEIECFLLNRTDVKRKNTEIKILSDVKAVITL